MNGRLRFAVRKKHILWYVQLSQFELLTLLRDLSVLYFLVFCMEADVLLKIHACEFYSVMSWVLCWIYYFLHHQSQHLTTALTMPRQYASKGLMILHHDSICSLSDHLNRTCMHGYSNFFSCHSSRLQTDGHLSIPSVWFSVVLGILSMSVETCVFTVSGSSEEFLEVLTGVPGAVLVLDDAGVGVWVDASLDVQNLTGSARCSKLT